MLGKKKKKKKKKKKGKEVEGCELKLHRLTADKKLRKVRWAPLSETGKKKLPL